MARKTVHLKSKERRGRSETAAFFRELAEKIESNELVMQRGDDQIRLELPETFEFEIEVEEKRKRGGNEFEIEIELEWNERETVDEKVTLG